MQKLNGQSLRRVGDCWKNNLEGAGMNALRVLGGCVLLLCLAGCGNFMSIHRENDISPSKDGGARLTLADAKQRAVISSRQPSGPTVVCAEPSPDVMQALAASNSLAFTDEKRTAQIANQLSDSAANIGLRTQSIQLLRDGMYRLCEGYAGGALGEGEFSSLQRRYQNLMLGLLAIEQLTGAVSAPQTALISGGAASAGALQADLKAMEAAWKTQSDELSELEKSHQIAKQDSAKAKDALKAIEEKIEATQDDDEAKADLVKQHETAAAEVVAKDAEVGRLAKNISTQKALVDSAKQAIQSAQAKVTAATSSQAQFNQTRGIQNPEVTEKIASAVTSIVSSVISTSFTQESCHGFLMKALQPRGDKETAIPDSLFQACIAHMQIRVETETGILNLQLKNLSKTK